MNLRGAGGCSGERRAAVPSIELLPSQNTAEIHRIEARGAHQLMVMVPFPRLPNTSVTTTL